MNTADGDYEPVSREVTAAQARTHFSETLDVARDEPLAITRHGRRVAVLMDADLARRALLALEDAHDVAAAESAMADPAPSVAWEDVRRELGLT